MTKPLLDPHRLHPPAVRDAEAIFAEGAREIARSLDELQRRAGLALRRVRPRRRRNLALPAATVVAGVAAGAALVLLLTRRRPRS